MIYNAKYIDDEFSIWYVIYAFDYWTLDVFNVNG